ncbi:MAG: helix-turn-helix transcriptional regulator [Parasporobacterium sp.]|nr:helix-turn-helix transcriptional regulator [Parasporobacterium sp.]
MFNSLFSSLLANLLHVSIRDLDDTEAQAKAFEEKYCYDPLLQPVFTGKQLIIMISSMEDQIIYAVRDELGLSIQFFRFDKTVYIVGPYAGEEFDPVKTQRALLKHGISASFVSSIRLYYSAFPILTDMQVRNTACACIRSFIKDAKEYAFCHLTEVRAEAGKLKDVYETALDYSTLYERYDRENRFLSLVERGDTENVLEAYREMSAGGQERNRYVNAVYTEPYVGLSMVRTMARKAAERGGASLVEIDEITQRCVQRLYRSKSLAEQIRHNQTMIYELTDAVRRRRYQNRDYSAPIQKTVEYLNLNFSQKTELAQLGRWAGLSEAYLSKTFKKEVGMTISQYIARLRCQMAARILKRSDIPIQEISSYVGYPDNNYFVKVFKAQYGMTPSEYRTQI